MNTIQRLLTVGFTILGVTLAAATSQAAQQVTYPQLLQILHEQSSQLQSAVTARFGRFPAGRQFVADTARLHQMAERIEQAGVTGHPGTALQGLQKFDRQLAQLRLDFDVVTRGGQVGRDPVVAGLLRQLTATSARLQGHSHLRPVVSAAPVAMAPRPVVVQQPVVVHQHVQPYYAQPYPARGRYGRGGRSGVYIQTPNLTIGVAR